MALVLIKRNENKRQDLTLHWLLYWRKKVLSRTRLGQLTEFDFES